MDRESLNELSSTVFITNFPQIKKGGCAITDDFQRNENWYFKMNVNDGSYKCSMSISESNQIPFLPSYLPTASLCYKMNTVRTYKTIYKLLAKQGNALLMLKWSNIRSNVK